MRKDYAKNDFTQGKKSTRKKRYVELLLVILLCLLIGGISYAGFAVTHPEWREKVAGWTASIKSLLVRHNADAARDGRPKATAQIEYDNEVRFDFYSELPKAQVESLPVASDTVAVAASAKEYVLRIGEFVDPVRASELRISLLLAGVDAEVIKVSQDGKDVYRVQQGYATAAQAQAKQKRLQKKGIESKVIAPAE